MPSTQSAYRQLHSTETAVTIYNDLLSAADSGQLTALSAGLDSPFDTVDHELLLLQSNVSLVCAALFFDGFSLICLTGTCSVRWFCVYCLHSVLVPQGSVHGCLLSTPLTLLTLP